MEQFLTNTNIENFNSRDQRSCLFTKNQNRIIFDGAHFPGGGFHLQYVNNYFIILRQQWLS